MTAQAQALNVTSTGPVVAGPCTYRGFWIQTSTGATVTLYDNASAASGTVLAVFTNAAAGDRADDITDGVRCANGIYLQVSTGTVLGHVRVG